MRVRERKRTATSWGELRFSNSSTTSAAASTSSSGEAVARKCTSPPSLEALRGGYPFSGKALRRNPSALSTRTCRGAEVGAQDVDHPPREELLEPLGEFRGAPPPPVDALPGVSHGEDRPGEALQEAQVGPVDVLVLVHQDVPPGPPPVQVLPQEVVEVVLALLALEEGVGIEDLPLLGRQGLLPPELALEGSHQPLEFLRGGGALVDGEPGPPVELEALLLLEEHHLPPARPEEFQGVGVEGGHPDPLRLGPEERLKALPHFLRRLPGEGDHEDLLRGNPEGLHHVGGARGEDPGLPAPRPRYHHHLPVGSRDRLPLLGAQALEEPGHRGP